MPASLVAAGIGAVGSIVGSNKAANAAKEAAASQERSTAKALALQEKIYNANVDRSTPYVQVGVDAQTQMRNATGLNGADAQKSYYTNFQYDPYYDSIVKAGTNAIGNSWLARGSGYGGNALLAVSDWGSKKGKEALDYRYNQLSDLYKGGLTATNALAGVGTSFADSSSKLLTDSANNGTNSNYAAGLYNASGIVGVTNALSGAAGKHFDGYNDGNASNNYWNGLPGEDYSGVSF